MNTLIAFTSLGVVKKIKKKKAEEQKYITKN